MEEEKNYGYMLREIRRKIGMNRREFAEYFGIAYRTVQDWELGHRRMLGYVFDLIVYKIEKEKLVL